MGQTNFDISMSLDGYITAAGQTAEAPLGEGGERLHEWAFGGDERDRTVLEEGVAGTGAVITGRRNYEHSMPWWGAGGPTGEARLPVIVVSHSVPSDAPEGGVYEFVSDGIEAALDRAREAAGAKDVTVMGGANTGQQYLRAGLIDRVSIHLARSSSVGARGCSRTSVAINRGSNAPAPSRPTRRPTSGTAWCASERGLAPDLARAPT